MAEPRDAGPVTAAPGSTAPAAPDDRPVDRPAAAGQRVGADPTGVALAPLRQRIDAIDHQIVALLNERAQIALEIGRLKQDSGRRAVRDARREAEVIEHVTTASAGLLPEPELIALYRKLIAATRRVQHGQRRRAAAGRTPGDEASPDPGGPRDQGA